MIRGRKLCAALRGLRSEALRLAQAVALEAVEALEALALMLRSTLGLISMTHGAGALFSSAQDCQALEPMLGSQVVALDALKAQALTLSSTPGLISLALALVHSSAQDCQAVALEALVALALMLSSMLGLTSRSWHLVSKIMQRKFWHVMPSIWKEFFAFSKIKFVLCIIVQLSQMGMSATPFSSLWS